MNLVGLSPLSSSEPTHERSCIGVIADHALAVALGFHAFGKYEVYAVTNPSNVLDGRVLDGEVYHWVIADTSRVLLDMDGWKTAEEVLRDFVRFDVDVRLMPVHIDEARQIHSNSLTLSLSADEAIDLYRIATGGSNRSGYVHSEQSEICLD